MMRELNHHRLDLPSIKPMRDGGVDRDGKPLPAITIASLKTWRVACEYHAERPDLGGPVQ